MEEKIMTRQPLITVVTVCYNAAATIEETIKSVINQTYPNIEYLIIDGASTDGTVDIIKRYQDRIAYWVSEPDKGIYDAMNKGIKKATGEWINFMNAGDGFYAPDVLEKVAPSMTEDVDVVYGDIICLRKTYKYRKTCSELSTMDKAMVMPHPATFVRLSFHKKHLFDISFKSSGDYHFFYNAYYSYHCQFLYVPMVVSKFDDMVGMSKDNVLLPWLENARIFGKDKNLFYILMTYMRYFLFIIRKCVKMIIPNKLLERREMYLIGKLYDIEMTCNHSL